MVWTRSGLAYQYQAALRYQLTAVLPFACCETGLQALFPT